MSVRVVLPPHLRTIAKINGEVTVDAGERPTVQTLLDELERRYPALRGTIRDRITLKRRPFVRFFACERDLSHESPEAPLPDAVSTGSEPFLIVGAMAGG
jgi:sulfur-carrier protein